MFRKKKKKAHSATCFAGDVAPWLCCGSVFDDGGAPAGPGLGDGHGEVRRVAAGAPVTPAWARDGLALRGVEALRGSPASSGESLLRCTKKRSRGILGKRPNTGKVMEKSRGRVGVYGDRDVQETAAE